MGKQSVPGKIYLVGAGPGDPELLTIKALKLIKAADTIVYDRLINPHILEEAKTNVRLIFVGKEPGAHLIDQEKINEILLEEAKKGRVVVRLKGGDPFVFGRGGEEARALKKMNIPFEVVPGVTSALGVPELAGIPLTDRDLASSFTVVTGHRAGKNIRKEVNFKDLDSDTIVILMGLANIEKIVRELKIARPNDTPVAVIQQGSTENERTIVGTLSNIMRKVKAEKIRAPTIIVVGEVVKIRKEITDDD